ncbi:glycosyltransferase [Algoriphagus sp. D3-2-R+10]|uniref:glycosyltransferase family 4 protein n=1 Tax=Algoriphagus aurantiacus TaxID=3103948 RepID=UPI002B3FD761|nr:glycosyltransferase [Algoriphagus sp. D3-2-R+10]MEB2777529.1 glycosyltransferase [Algoriphagus sp. D3-2-R+10]
MVKILFLGETYRADAKSWIKGIERESKTQLETMEIRRSNSRPGRIFNSLLFFFQILKTRFGSKYDLVLAERATSYGMFSLLVHAKVRIVAQQGITDAFPEEGFSGFYKRIIQRLVYQKVDMIHAWGHVMSYAMLNSGAAPHKILVLPKGIDLDLYRFSYPDKTSDRSLSLIVTRSLFELYRHEDILKSISILRDNGFKVKVVLVGDGPEKPKLVKLCSELNIQDQVNFTGLIANDKLPELLSQSSFYVAFPTTEGVSSSLFEAMATGCFPIVSDLPANQAFLSQKKNGILVPVENVSQLADSIRYAVEHPGMVERAIWRNRKYIEKQVDFKKNMNVIYQRYLSLLAKKSA